MRFTVIGNLRESIFLVDAVHHSEQHEVGSCCIEGELAAEFSQRQIPFFRVSSAEEAILTSDTDVVIVASSDADDSIRLVRLASQEECHVIAVLPDDVSTAWSYELHMLLDESRAGIVPLTGRWFVDRDGSSEDAIRSMQQLHLSLPLSNDLTRQRRRQLHGIDALCGIGLRFTQVTGLDVPGADGVLLNRTTTLAASDKDSSPVPPATIHFKSRDQSECVLQISMTDGTSRELSVFVADPAALTYSPVAQRQLGRIVDALQNNDDCQTGMLQLSGTLELHEGLDKSLRRRRTVDVYVESVSERAVFKTQMTAMGCGVLAYLSFGLVAYLVMAQVLKPPPMILNIARIIWIAPLVIFLAAQLLLPLARQRDSVQSSEKRGDTP